MGKKKTRSMYIGDASHKDLGEQTVTVSFVVSPIEFYGYRAENGGFPMEMNKLLKANKVESTQWRRVQSLKDGEMYAYLSDSGLYRVKAMDRGMKKKIFFVDSGYSLWEKNFRSYRELPLIFKDIPTQCERFVLAGVELPDSSPDEGEDIKFSSSHEEGINWLRKYIKNDFLRGRCHLTPKGTIIFDCIHNLQNLGDAAISQGFAEKFLSDDPILNTEKKHFTKDRSSLSPHPEIRNAKEHISIPTISQVLDLVLRIKEARKSSTYGDQIKSEANAVRSAQNIITCNHVDDEDKTNNIATVKAIFERFSEKREIRKVHVEEVEQLLDDVIQWSMDYDRKAFEADKNSRKSLEELSKGLSTLSSIVFSINENTIEVPNLEQLISDCYITLEIQLNTLKGHSVVNQEEVTLKLSEACSALI